MLGKKLLLTDNAGTYTTVLTDILEYQSGGIIYFVNAHSIHITSFVLF